MRASDAKPFIGKLVKYEKNRWGAIGYGVVVGILGRNIILDGDALWAPDIKNMVEVPQEGQA